MQFKGENLRFSSIVLMKGMANNMSMNNFLDDRLNHLFDDIYYDLNLLSLISSDQTKKIILNHLSNNIFLLEYFTKAMYPSVQLQPLPLTQQPANTDNQRVYTLQELSIFDGKNGKPAYVAVNGTIYDVTNNATWAAATHFGLQAGRDLTSDFLSCHAGQPILNNLNVVGRLVEYE